MHKYRRYLKWTLYIFLFKLCNVKTVWGQNKTLEWFFTVETGHLKNVEKGCKNYYIIIIKNSKIFF